MNRNALSSLGTQSKLSGRFSIHESRGGRKGVFKNRAGVSNFLHSQPFWMEETETFTAEHISLECFIHTRFYICLEVGYFYKSCAFTKLLKMIHLRMRRLLALYCGQRCPTRFPSPTKSPENE